MKKPTSEPGDSATTGDDHAAPPPTDSGSLGDASSSRATAPRQPSDQQAESAAAAFDACATPADPDSVWSLVLTKFGRGRRGGVDLAARAFLNPAIGVGMVSSPGLATPRALEKPESEPSDSAAAGANDAPSSTTLRRLCTRSGTVGTAPTSCSTAPPRPPKLHSAMNPQWEALIAKWNMLKGQEWEVDSNEGLVDCIANHMRLLEDKQEELNQVEQQQQQKGATLQLKEDALLLERLLLRERRAKLEEEEASRARRINSPRLPMRNNDDGFMCSVGAAYYTDHTVRVLAVSGTNACPDLFLPRLQVAQISDSASVRDGIPLTSSAPVPATSKPKAEDEIWNKRQLGYILFLGLAVGLVFLVRPLLPDGFDQFLLAGFAAVWGLGSVGLPLGIFGTTRLEKNLSRHIGRFISLCFTDVLIYAIYRLAVLPVDAPSVSAYSSPSPAPKSGLALGLWEFVFGIIAALVTAGHAISWIMGYRTGGDRDLEPYEDKIDT